MSELKVSGKFVKQFETAGVSKEGKDWKKTEFVVLTDEKFPQNLCFGVMDKLVEQVAKLQSGQDVTVHFNIKCNEYNGKYFVNLSAWRIEVSNMPNYATQSEASTPASSVAGNDLDWLN